MYKHINKEEEKMSNKKTPYPWTPYPWFPFVDGQIDLSEEEFDSYDSSLEAFVIDNEDMEGYQHMIHPENYNSHNECDSCGESIELPYPLIKFDKYVDMKLVSLAPEMAEAIMCFIKNQHNIKIDRVAAKLQKIISDKVGVKE